MESRPRILHILLSESDAELRRQDRDGRTALHHAVRVANVPVVSLLISYLRRFRLTLDDIDCRGCSVIRNAIDALIIGTTQQSTCIYNATL